MNKKTLDNILKFRGDIASSFNFLMNIYDDLGFQLQTNLQAVTNSYATFGNSIRSYRQKGLLQPVQKSGVKLILTGKNLLQYLLIQRILTIGGNLKDLQQVVSRLTDKQLQDLILKEVLSLNDLPILTKSKSIPSSLSTNTIDSEIPVWYNLKLISGIQLSISANQYSADDVKRIRSILMKALDDM